MIRAMTCVCLVLATSSAVAAQTPRADPEHARLTALAGTWDVEMTFKFRPDGPGIPTKGTSTIRSLLGGLFIEEKIEGALNGTPFTTLAWTGYNTGTKQYEATRIASTNTARIAEAGSYDERTRTLRAQGGLPAGGRDVAPAHGHSAHLSRQHDRDELLELRHRAGVEGRGNQIHEKAMRPRGSSAPGSQRRLPRLDDRDRAEAGPLGHERQKPAITRKVHPDQRRGKRAELERRVDSRDRRAQIDVDAPQCLVAFRIEKMPAVRRPPAPLNATRGHLHLRARVRKGLDEQVETPGLIREVRQPVVVRRRPASDLNRWSLDDRDRRGRA